MSEKRIAIREEIKNAHSQESSIAPEKSTDKKDENKSNKKDALS